MWFVFVQIRIKRYQRMYSTIVNDARINNNMLIKFNTIDVFVEVLLFQLLQY